MLNKILTHVVMFKTKALLCIFGAMLEPLATVPESKNPRTPKTSKKKKGSNLFGENENEQREKEHKMGEEIRPKHTFLI